jgi:endonuclease/exonuclease/phosphatase family metal-dependent hydrolase
MMILIKRIIRKLIFIIAICCSTVLVISNLAPFAEPSKWWPMALLGILFPLLLGCTFLFFLVFIFVKRKKALFPFLAIVISIPNISTSFGFNVFSTFKEAKAKEQVRVLTWNVGLMNYTALDSNEAIKNNTIILDKIKQANADIVCLQEFFTAVIPGNHYNFIDSISKTMQYPYHYFSRDIPKFEGNFYSGNIIFSKYKIIDTQKIIYPKPFYGSIIKATVIMAQDTTDVFTTRLQSVHFGSSQYKELGDIKKGKDSGFVGTKNIIQKLRLGYKQRTAQVNIAKDFLSTSKRPLIFTGDFNDVPVSYTYHFLKSNLQDCWQRKGTGFGRTFVYISPTLRIDHIFFNNNFSVVQGKRIFADGGSDHNAVVSDLAIIRKN